MVILARHGYRHGYFKVYPGLQAPDPLKEDFDFGAPEAFVMQKHRVLERFGNLINLLKRGRELCS